MRLVEDSYYDHGVYGRVELLHVGEDRVAFSQSETGHVDVQRREKFEKHSEPADIEIEPEKGSLESETPNPE